MEKASNKPLRRRPARKVLRRFTLGLGLAFVISPFSATAREKAPSPRRSDRATPWTEPGRLLSPPRPPGSAEAPTVHPAIHGRRSSAARALFPRASEAPRDDRAAAMARHPAGKGRSDPEPKVTVEPGDSLWSIAEGRVGRAQAPQCWPELYAVNRSTIGPNPDHIEPGQRLSVPKECR